MEYTTKPLLLTKHPPVMKATSLFPHQLPLFHLVAPCHQTLQVCTLLQVPVSLYRNSKILTASQPFYTYSNLHIHTHTKKVMKQRIGNSCIIQSIYIKLYGVTRMRVHKNYISNNFSNSALPPTSVEKRKHIEEVTYIGYSILQVQAVHGLFTVQFCIHKYNIQQ